MNDASRHGPSSTREGHCAPPFPVFLRGQLAVQDTLHVRDEIIRFFPWLQHLPSRSTTVIILKMFFISVSTDIVAILGSKFEAAPEAKKLEMS